MTLNSRLKSRTFPRNNFEVTFPGIFLYPRCSSWFYILTEDTSCPAVTVYTRLDRSRGKDRVHGPSICIKRGYTRSSFAKMPFERCTGSRRTMQRECVYRCTCPSRFDVTLMCNFRPRVLASNKRIRAYIPAWLRCSWPQWKYRRFRRDTVHRDYISFDHFLFHMLITASRANWSGISTKTKKLLKRDCLKRDNQEIPEELVIWILS